MLDEFFLDKDGNMALYTFLRNTGRVRNLWDRVAGVGSDTGEDNALRGVDAFDGADDAFVEADDEVAGVVVEELGVDS